MEDSALKGPMWSEMTLATQTSKVGMRQFARLGGEAMISSKTSVGETKMLWSFARMDVDGADEGESSSAVVGVMVNEDEDENDYRTSSETSNR